MGVLTVGYCIVMDGIKGYLWVLKVYNSIVLWAIIGHLRGFFAIVGY